MVAVFLIGIADGKDELSLPLVCPEHTLSGACAHTAFEGINRCFYHKRIAGHNPFMKPRIFILPRKASFPPFLPLSTAQYRLSAP